MKKNHGPLSDYEAKTMVYLFRVVRAGNDRPGEKEQLQLLLRRWKQFNKPEIRGRNRKESK